MRLSDKRRLIKDAASALIEAESVHNAICQISSHTIYIPDDSIEKERFVQMRDKLLRLAADLYNELVEYENQVKDAKTFGRDTEKYTVRRNKK